MQIAASGDLAKGQRAQLRFLGGAIKNFSHGALPLRESVALLTLGSSVVTDADVEWVNAARDATEKYSAGFTFFNFMDCDVPGNLWSRFFGENAERVLQIKEKWDPKNRLRVFCSWKNDV